MMKSLLILSTVLSVVFSLSINVKAATATSSPSATIHLQDASYLRKLSFHLRGLPPTAPEYQALKAAQAKGEQAAFFERKIDEYQTSEQYSRKMSFRLEELFRLKTMEQPVPLPRGGDFDMGPYSERNALNSLFMSLTQQNLSWDTLLTGKSYQLYPKTPSDFGVLSDLAFMRALAPDRLPGLGKNKVGNSDPIVPTALAFDANDSRVAGALTTARFFNRYTTTELNKNRRRAAAVFNVFLCDPMAAAVPPPPKDPGGILDRAFPDTSTITEDDIRRVATRPDKHGSDQACAQCHYKLDPMGQAFAASNVTLSPFPTAGRLVYKDKETGVLIDRPGRGLGDLALEITKQSQYVNCQVSYFWKWFIGDDRTLTPARRTELVAAFDSVGRRTNDFIKVMVKAPEFRDLDLRTPQESRAAQVKSILKNCMNCHSAKISPDFTRWPIGGSPMEMQRWVSRISDRLDLPGAGAKRSMPPAWSDWQPSQSEIEFLKSWVEDGAPDEDGNRQI